MDGERSSDGHHYLANVDFCFKVFQSLEKCGHYRCTRIKKGDSI